MKKHKYFGKVGGTYRLIKWVHTAEEIFGFYRDRGPKAL